MLTLRWPIFRGADVFTVERTGLPGDFSVFFDPVPPKRADLIIGFEGRDLTASGGVNFLLRGPTGVAVVVGREGTPLASLNRMLLVPPGWIYGVGMETLGIPHPYANVAVIRLELLPD